MSSRISKNVERLIGSTWWEIIQYRYLMEKYQTSCVFFPWDFHPISDSEYSSVTEKAYGGVIALTWVCKAEGKNCSLYPPSVLNSWVKYTNYLVECIKNSKRLSIIPLELYIKNIKGHSNTLVFDKVSKTLERFDPNGGTSDPDFAPSELDSQLEKLFSIILKPLLNGEKLKYMSPLDFCPKIGVQMIEKATRIKLGVPIERGFCSVWAFVYSNFRLRFPEQDRSTITKFLVSDKRGNLYTYIENVIVMVARLSESLRKAKDDDEIQKILIKETKYFGGKF